VTEQGTIVRSIAVVLSMLTRAILNGAERKTWLPGGLQPLSSHDSGGRGEQIRRAYHVRASVAQAVVGPLTNNTIRGSTLTVEFWIDQETQALLRARISEPPDPQRPHPAVWTIDFSHHGEDITIEPPVQD